MVVMLEQEARSMAGEVVVLLLLAALLSNRAATQMVALELLALFLAGQSHTLAVAVAEQKVGQAEPLEQVVLAVGVVEAIAVPGPQEL
jgi:hypothetical protein